MTIGNDGTFGSHHGLLVTDPYPGPYSPSLEFPAGTEKDYLFMGSLWIGGIVGADTLVSLGHEGWAGPGYEFHGFESIATSFDTVRGQQDFLCRYQDTLILADYYGFTWHTRLGLDVSQTSHAWQSGPYGRLVIAEHTIRNISADTIVKAYIGLFADADIWPFGGPGGPHDDLSGYLAEDVIAYSIDNDGDPVGGTWT